MTDESLKTVQETKVFQATDTQTAHERMLEKFKKIQTEKHNAPLKLNITLSAA